jgi:hypothetical protein
MFISGYGFLWQNVELPEFAKDRLRLSSQFAAIPTEVLASQLRDSGVEYFIIDKSRIDTASRTDRETILLEDERFQLISVLP